MLLTLGGDSRAHKSGFQEDFSTVLEMRRRDFREFDMAAEAIRISAKGKSFKVFVTPDQSQLRKIGNVLRFTADNQAKVLHVWNYDAAVHSEVSSALKLRDTTFSTNLLRGSAIQKSDGSYALNDLHFPKSFATDWTISDRQFLSQLLNQDWSWVDSSIRVTDWLSGLNEAMSPTPASGDFEQ